MAGTCQEYSFSFLPVATRYYVTMKQILLLTEVLQRMEQMHGNASLRCFPVKIDVGQTLLAYPSINGDGG